MCFIIQFYLWGQSHVTVVWNTRETGDIDTEYDKECFDRYMTVQTITSILLVEKHLKHFFTGCATNWKKSFFNFVLPRIMSSGKITDKAVNSDGKRINNLECLDPYFSNVPPIKVNENSKADPKDTV